MASYYYLVSSLPTLSADQSMPFSYSDFLVMCQSNVSEKTYALLEGLTLSSEEGPLLKAWGSFYNTLLKELASQRSAKLGKPYPPLTDRDPQSAAVVASAMAAKDPLTAENILLDYEFTQLDNLVGLHVFDDSVLFGYALKLKLLERAGRFDPEKGKTEFSNILSQLQQQVMSL